MELLETMDDSKKEVSSDLEWVPDGVAIIPGVTACGKSTFLQFVIFALFLGSCPPESAPREAERAKTKVLYCKVHLPSPSTLPDFQEKPWLTSGLRRCEQQRRSGYLCDEPRNQMAKASLGGNAPDIIRLYPMDCGVDEMLLSSRNTHGAFNREEAIRAANDPEFSEVDRFLAQVAGQAHDEKAAHLKSKNGCKNMSLQQAAHRYHKEDLDKYPVLQKLLVKVGCGEELSKEELSPSKLSRNSCTETAFRISKDLCAALQSLPTTTISISGFVPTSCWWTRVVDSMRQSYISSLLGSTDRGSLSATSTSLLSSWTEIPPPRMRSSLRTRASTKSHTLLWPAPSMRVPRPRTFASITGRLGAWRLPRRLLFAQSAKASNGTTSSAATATASFTGSTTRRIAPGPAAGPAALDVARL